MSGERLETLRSALPWADDPLAAAGPLALAVAALAAAAATALFARAAAGAGLLDRAPGAAEAARKLQARPVPQVGGLALLAGALAGWLVAGTGAAPFGAAGAAALVLAFAVGLADDLLPRGIPPLAKLAGQLASALPVSLTVGARSGWGAGLAVLLAAPVAMNALNTFDNADGAAASLGVAALAMPLPLGAAALLGFLPFNANGRAHGPGRAAPSAYLGDAGSHLLGMAILLAPPAWPALALPLLDLGRCAALRLRAGQAPWTGDRRHLAHRLQERGLGTAGVVIVLLAVALPSLLAADAAVATRSLEPLAWGLVGTAALFAAAVVGSRPRARLST